MTVLERVRQQLKSNSQLVWLTRDFHASGSATQVHRALRTLVEESSLLRIGLGLYVEPRISSVTAQLVPPGSLETLAADAMRRLNIHVGPGAAARAYNSGETNQLPGQLVANTGHRKIQRVIEVGGRRLLYEHGLAETAHATSRSGGLDHHGAQDLQSLLMHREAVRLLIETPKLVARVEQTLARWRQRDDPNSAGLLKLWAKIVSDRDWPAALEDSELGRQLRQASPLATLLSPQCRLAIIHRVKALKKPSG